MRLFRKIKKNWCKIDIPIWNFINYITFFMNDVKCDFGLMSRGKIYINNDDGKIEIGKNARLNSGRWTNPVGNGNKIWMQIGKNASLYIGDDVGISNVEITCFQKIVVGNRVMIGSGTQIYDTDFHSLNAKYRWDLSYAKTAPIIIEDDAFIGANVTVLKGVTIGKGSVVGAGSVVTKSILPNQIWAGNPARYIKDNNYVD